MINGLHQGLHGFMELLAHVDLFVDHRAGQNSFGRLNTRNNTLLRDRARAFAIADFVKFEMIEGFETGEFQRVPRAVQRTAINREDAFRRDRPVDQRLDAPADARETGHFRRAVARELARNAVGQFARVRAARAGVHHRARLLP